MPDIVPCPECKAPTYVEPDMSGGLRRILAGPFSEILANRKRAETAEARVAELETAIRRLRDAWLADEGLTNSMNALVHILHFGRATDSVSGTGREP